jgi:hypothetical protein
MSSSSPSQAKAARSKDSKANGNGSRAGTTALKSTSAPQAQAAGVRPSDGDIARRAYEIYERDGRQPGTELQNWLAAEAELSGSKGH